MADLVVSARLFLALWPAPQVRQALAACRDAIAWPAGASPTADAKLHLTLHFIGSVPAAQVDAIAAALQVPVQGFELRLDRVERWPGGTMVLRPAAVPQPLLQCHADLAEALWRVDLPVESRAYRPHVTLARRVAAAMPLAPTAPATPIHWPVAGYALLRSQPDGRYSVLARYR